MIQDLFFCLQGTVCVWHVADKYTYFGSVASTKFNHFQLIKFKCHKINSIENQHFSYLSDSIFLKEKQKNRQMRQNPDSMVLTNGVLGVFSGKIGLLFYGLLVFILSDLNFLPAF